MPALRFLVPALIAVELVLVFTGAIPAALVLGIGLASWFAWVLVRKVLRRSIWRLRNRLMVTYVFVGAVPVLLILALAYFGTWAIVGQVAAYLVTSELNRRAATLEEPAKFICQVPAERRTVLIEQLAAVLGPRFPGLRILVSGPAPLRYPAALDWPELPSTWKDSSGIVEKDGAYYLFSTIGFGFTRAALFAPLTADVVEQLVPGIGALKIASRSRLAGAIPPAENALDFEFPWFNNLAAGTWADPAQRHTIRLTVITRPSAVLSTVSTGQASNVQDELLILIALFGVVELISIVLGSSMTRTITGAVHNLYTGTQQIAHGDFSHRIPAGGSDQLAELGRSFNQMSEHLERLLVVAKEKERLQSELSIASDVQKQLFPRCPPPMRTIKLTGTCAPARSASGDYYDYLCLPNGNLAFAIGDVAGKGISAALLMASIQSIMRTQLASGIPSPARLVAQLNRQLHESTSPEKYATFFFALYDENSRVLTYTNAGHLSPLIVCDGQVKPLEVTGTVVGLFPVVSYEEQTVTLHHDDLLVAYTDGITEPENAYGEEFGSERLTEVVLRNQNCEPAEIVARVMDAVTQWSHAPELPDDMTVLVARGIA